MDVIFQDLNGSMFGLINVDEASRNYICDCSIVVGQSRVVQDSSFCFVSGIIPEDMREDFHSGGASTAGRSVRFKPHNIGDALVTDTMTTESMAYISLNRFSVSG